jgi:hypothetical protein
VTVVPTRTVTITGENAKFLMATESVATGAVCPGSATAAEAVIPGIDVITGGAAPADAFGAAPHPARAATAATASGSANLTYFTIRPPVHGRSVGARILRQTDSARGYDQRRARRPGDHSFQRNR